MVSAAVALTGGLTSLFTSLYVLPIVAASTVQFRRGALQVAALGSLLYAGIVLGAVRASRPAASIRCSGLTIGGELPTRSVAQYTVGLNVFGLFAVAFLSGLAGRARAPRRRPAGAGVRRARRPAVLQPVRHRQSGQRPGDGRRGESAADVQSIGGADYRARARHGRRASRRSRSCSCRTSFARSLDEDIRAHAQQAHRSAVPPAGRSRHRPRPERRAAAAAGRPASAISIRSRT